MQRAGQGACQALLVKLYLLKGWSPRMGLGSTLVQRHLPKTPEAAGPLERLCLGTRSRQVGLLLVCSSSVHKGCIREQRGSRAGVTQVLLVLNNSFGCCMCVLCCFSPELHKCSWLSQLIVNDMRTGGKWITEATGKFICSENNDAIYQRGFCSFSW